MEIGSHVISLGGIRVGIGAAERTSAGAAERGRPTAPRSGCSTRRARRTIIQRIDAAKKAGDTLGGEVEVVARGVVVGLGSHVSWDRKLDGRLAGMLMSIPAVKGVEIGMGFEAARRPGSEVHDPIDGGAGGAAGQRGGTAPTLGADFGGRPTMRGVWRAESPPGNPWLLR